MDADRYRLAPELPVVFDAERFEHDARTLLRADTIDAARLSATLTLERGDLFEGDALRHYDRLVSVLRDTFDSDPEPQTVELAEKIRQGPL